MNEFAEKKVVINNYLVNYYYSDTPNSNCTVIFIHGWLSNSKVWFHLMHALKKIDISSYALDLPGFGASQIPSTSVDNGFFVSIIEDFIKKLNLNNVILVGHSNGGAIATKYVIKNSNIRKLVLIDAAGIRKQTAAKSLINFLAKAVSPAFKVPALKPLRQKIYSAMGWEDYLDSTYLQDTYKNVIGEDISQLYKQVNLPTLIIWGKNDKATPLEYGNFINSNIVNSDLAIIDSGHFPFVDKPNEVINLLINFIK